MQEKACEIYKDNKLFGTRTQDQYSWMTYSEFGEIVQTCRKVLAQHNIASGTGVAIISNNRYEWAATSYAALSLGAPVIPM
jgi:long-chain acyl-CoA synthetase